jgi:hypothetical protein
MQVVLIAVSLWLWLVAAALNLAVVMTTQVFN